ncbi:protein jim lovell isoform X3 [Galleria mellonella]|uniref:Protein jim lovell isoform X3 n=1 Tax=Galleria mellonella TaxID=7137 RepID=A0ABM3N1M3_GALME|nr:protein jim lovell isoform X3 [Galleria mellonella]
MKMMPQQYCLRWKHHHSNVQNMFAQLLEKERFCDVTLYCSPSFATQVPNKDTVDPQNIRGVSLRAHRVVLAACSELLGALLGAHEAQGEPVLVIDGAEPKHLKALLDYMYTGEMNVHHSQLASLLKTAEELRIKGLTDIRWNNKDEPPDCDTGVVTAVATHEKKSTEKVEKQLSPKHAAPKQSSPKQTSPKHTPPKSDSVAELRPCVEKEDSEKETKSGEKFSVNGGPPPLIKLPMKEKTSPVKRDRSDSESPSPKRRRATSATEHTDDDSVSHKSDRDQEWQHGNLDISAERVVAWGMGSEQAGEWSRDGSDDEWADAPADIGSFLHTRLRVDGDNSADEESNESGAAAAPPSAPSSSSSAAASDLKLDFIISKPTIGPKSGPTDPRFTDVVKLSDYLQHGRRPQFWEENYVKRVMEAVRVKELEMKQAAEILGVSYGTLYGRYRDVYGCINRPYRTARDFWQAKGPADVLDKLQRGELSLDAAALALGVSINNLSAYMSECPPVEKEFEPIPIEIDPSLKLRARTYNNTKASMRNKQPAPAPASATVPAPAATDKPKKVLIGSLTDEDPIPATVITTHEGKNAFVANTSPATATATSGKWPSIRVASLDSLRASGGGSTGGSSTESLPASPSQLMRSRPDLTIVAARRPDTKREDNGT